MKQLIVNNILINIGAYTQQYQIQYKRTVDVVYTNGPTLNYYQAQATPLGLLPLIINLDDGIYGAETTIDFRINTICSPSETIVGDTQNISLTVNCT